MYRPQHVLAALVIELPLEQQLREAEDADHGGAQFMRGHGQELALHSVNFQLMRDVAEVHDGFIVVRALAHTPDQGSHGRCVQMQQLP